ncbi:diaminopimelate epimerase [Ancylobacter sp. 6x-1]|uniref:Diaminopimelate epimerase n=1 Tax=Ancylobacter crimeensis TaxID=2579147 RepID=A0ABT0DC51_9HYPH|nr:diaminopimelate epimerase [Ancylobacter crimeensis]MCK0197536.1 diaminopimelate epimerase [Ancylobacter crimeensis]
MATLANRPFVKMNGLGNEIVVLDLRADPVMVPPQEARALARPEALPFDQIMALYPPKRAGTDAFVRIINADGSEAGACGNGTRCIALYESVRTGRDHLVFESPAGLLDCRMVPDGITADMGAPRFGWQEIPLAHAVAHTDAVDLTLENLSSPALANVGNPHATFFVDEAEAVDLARLGPLLERHELFPDRANIGIARLLAPDHIRLDVWERGAGLTRACGSAACAAAVNAMRTGRSPRADNRPVRVSLPGGDLFIVWRAADDHILMTGPAETEFEGVLAPDMLGLASGTPA